MRISVIYVEEKYGISAVRTPGIGSKIFWSSSCLNLFILLLSFYVRLKFCKPLVCLTDLQKKTKIY